MAGKGLAMMSGQNREESQSGLRSDFVLASSAGVASADFAPGSPAHAEGLYWLYFGLRVMPVGRHSAWGIAPESSFAEAARKGRLPDIVCLFGTEDEIAGYAADLRGAGAPRLVWAECPAPARRILEGTPARVLSGERPSDLHAAFFDGSSPLFSCRMCGKCCEGRGGIVVSPRDLPRLRAFFGLPPAEVLGRFTEMMRGQPVIRCGEDGSCMFFREGKGCSIHPARPAVCRAWPFFRGNMVDSISFAMAREDCPGICRGCRHEDFAWEGWRYLVEYKLLADDPCTEGRMLIVKREDLPAG